MNRWRILTVGATDVILHPTVLLFLLYTCFTGHFVFSLLAFLSIILHEAAHGVTAALCGHPPAQMEITPLGAVMRLEDLSHTSFVQRILTVAAGPVSTLFLCAISVWSAKLGLFSLASTRSLFVCNIAILLMNLLPVVPLDGGRLLHLILELFLSRSAATKTVKIISYAGGILLILANLWVSWHCGGWNLSLAFAGCCILYNASTLTLTQTMAELRCFLDRKIQLERRGVLPTVSYTALHTTPLRKLIKVLPAGRFAMFYCLEGGTQRICGSMHESEIIQRYLDEPSQTFAKALAVPYNHGKFDKSSTI